MSQPQLPPDGLRNFDRFRFALRRVETENYSQRTQEFANILSNMRSQSAFWRINYGMINAESEFDELSRLAPNWDSYGAEAPSPAAISAARSILKTLCESLILPNAIVASASGGVSIYFFGGERTAYIENYNDGAQALVMYDRAGSTHVLEIGPEIASHDVAARILAYLD